MAAGPVVGAPARALLTRAARLDTAARAVLAAEAASAGEVREAWAALRDVLVREDLRGIPIERVRDAGRLPGGGRPRIAPLEQAGYRTVLDLVDATLDQLDAVPGVGRRTAAQLHSAARQIAAAAGEGVRVRISVEPDDPVSARLLLALHRHELVERAVAPVRGPATAIAADVGDLVRTARPARGRLRRLLAGAGRRAAADAATGALAEWLAWADQGEVGAGLDDAARRLAVPAPDPAAVRADFAARAAHYYALLGTLTRAPAADVPASEGFLPDDIVARIREQPLDDSLLHASLRGYQAFGARYALVQRRVVLGDEMGLGKTVQAIAVMAHLAAADLRAETPSHVLVVCPASVLVNWVREVGRHSALAVRAVHGDERQAAFTGWQQDGGVAVTTFETLRQLAPPADRPAGRPRLLVVDEAHFVMNPETLRSRAVASWAGVAERVLFLTGTPMENRVEEFRALVRQVRPQLADAIDGTDAAAGPVAFRRAVAPVYLRRNADDVLTELPDLVQVDEWEELRPDDLVAYRAAVASGNFMQVRRAAYAVGDPARCAKLERLVEIVEEARENRLKVVVFSFFRGVLGSVVAALEPVCGDGLLGPITGDVRPERRQGLVDDFTTYDGPAVLVSQIEAGGVGLNLQTASVVVLCEPQLKPTLEAQAVARVHRMGQVRAVRVHRLLSPDSVDERLLELLDHKRRLFDAFARRSEVAESTPDAVDLTEAELVRRVMAVEQDRLLHEPAADPAG